MANRRVIDGALRCCGRKAQLYKTKSIYYCHHCYHHYSLSGRDQGYHGSGLTKAAWIASASR